ncbi:MAG TPA: hypothetical protein IAB83_06545 [Candidatus Faecousia faecavium]|nr:hypothetical protein [Candidatus Faecousia faecavium]
MDDRVLALCELSGDLLFHKIPKNRLGYYVDQSLKAGLEAAKTYCGQSMQDIYRDNHIAIRYVEGGKKSYGVILRGQAVMSKDGCSVEVYQDSIETLAAYSELDGVHLTLEQALNVHLAHELYHIWEYQNNHSIVNDLEPIVSLQCLGIRRKSHIHKCEEIAAHTFAKELLKLPKLPNYFDYAYLIGTGKMSATSFTELVNSMSELLRCSDAQCH